ncbi:MAG: hypothetical protein JSW16_01855 [Dehalococcoidales bacterium]|nr:MAG: hypothetical protein JSW16_01855 [Dehalococcoidales bacterium]
MVRWKLKNCPRCGGDMFVSSDLYGWYQQCLQCSYRQDLKSTSKLKDQPLRNRKELVGTRGNRTKKG